MCQEVVVFVALKGQAVIFHAEALCQIVTVEIHILNVATIMENR